MLIGKVAAQYGVTADTLRYYDRIGLLKPGQNEGVRRYMPEDLHRLESIIKMKNLMFSLEEIACLLDMDAKVEQDLRRGKLENDVIKKMQHIVQAKCDDINRLESDLQRVRHYLQTMIVKIEGVLK